jgi:hypothetical protein
VLLDFSHPNTKDYPHQRIMVVAIDNYPYSVPYEIKNNEIILKTIFPDRRFKYLLECGDE